MTVPSKAIYIVGAKRTAFGAFGGKLAKLSSTQLAVHCSKAAIAEAGIQPEYVEDTYMGNVIQSSLDAPYLARHVALKSGLKIATPSLTINRLCGSGFETVCLGAESILLGRAGITLCGGSENMSQSPMVIDGLSARFGTALGRGLKAEDSLWAGLSDSHIKLPMGITAENLAKQYEISREQCDEYGLRSQNLWEKANKEGVFDAEIAPIEVKVKKGVESFATDEHPRAGTTLASLQKLKSVFMENGTVTAGNASGISDGAASLLVASEEATKSHGMKPLVRLVAWSRVGCDPSVMGIGPVEAIRECMKSSGLTLNDMDLVEINEAFAPQYLACEKELGIDPSKSNVNGGAIALGHPLGASGARILTHLTHRLNATGKKYGVGAACIGGGQGIAVVLENMQ